MASKKPARTARSAEQMAKGQRDISVSEFFEKNRHLLGFDNPLKALLTTVKEGVDNALDACEEAGVLPDITVEITRADDRAAIDAADVEMVCGFTGEVLDVEDELEDDAADGDEDDAESDDGASMNGADSRRAAESSGMFQRGLFDESEISEDEEAETAVKATGGAKTKKGRKRGVAAPAENYVVAIQDNGPGIVAEQVAKIFGKLLYGSKFHRLRQSRGQQGIGISAAGMYGQQTTGRPVRILTRTGARKPATYFEILMDVKSNRPDVKVQEERDWDQPQGTRVEIELKAKYQRGQRSVDAYLAATAVANPHVTLRYRDPEGSWSVYERASQTLPDEPREVKPHPHGVELGMFLRMVQNSAEKKVGGFLQNEFCRVSRKTAEEICDLAGLNTTTWLSRVHGEDAARLHEALSPERKDAVRLLNPPTDCICPIGEDLLIESMAREYPQAFLRAVTRSPSVYRGNPFQVEVALAFGKGVPADGAATILRFANRVPLLYQSGHCAISKAINAVPWRNYGVDQSRGAPPSGPLVVVAHVASVWVPFTSESKEAVAHYPEILKELKLALMECGRALGKHLKAERRRADALKKRDYIARYIPKISEALQGILELSDAERDRTTESLVHVLDRSRNL